MPANDGSLALALMNAGMPAAVANAVDQAINDAGAGGSAVSGADATIGVFAGKTAVRQGGSVQAAVDAAPNNLVTVITAGFTNHGGGIYSVAAPATLPDYVFIDADLAVRNDAAVGTGALVDPQSQAIADTLLWGVGGGRVYFYAGGAAVTRVALARYWLVTLGDGTYDGWIGKPGVIVSGAGADRTFVEQQVSRTVLHVSGTIEVVVAAAAYAGHRNLTIVRKAALNSDNACGLCFPVYADTDAYQMDNAPVVVDTTFGRGSASYRIGVMFGTGGSGTRGKAIQIRNSPMRNSAACDTFETMSSVFNGTAFFWRSPVDGTWFADGAAQTFVFINSPLTNFAGDRAKTLPVQFDYPYAYNCLAVAAHPGFVESLIFVNSPIYTVTNPGTIDPYRAFSWDGRVGMKFINSPVSAANFMMTVAGGGFNALQASRITSQGCDLPPLWVTAYTTTNLTPVVPISRRTASQSSVGATPMNVGCFSATFDTLNTNPRAFVRARGTFAANANTKTLTLQTGLVGTLSTLATTSGAYNGGSWALDLTLDFDGTGVNVVGRLVSPAFAAVEIVGRTALAAGQSFGLNLLATGVSNGDIVAQYQAMGFSEA